MKTGRKVREILSYDAASMEAALAAAPIDLIVLDVMLPGEDGLSICRRLSETGGPAIVMVSAMGDEVDRVLGLELGADDYLPKPCSPREVLATVRAALRQRQAAGARDDPCYRFEGWRIDAIAREVFNPEGALVDLTDGEFAVLRTFVERPRRVLSRDALLEAARRLLLWAETYLAEADFSRYGQPLAESYVIVA